LDFFPVVGSADDRTDGDYENVDQLVALRPVYSGIFQPKAILPYQPNYWSK